MATEQIIVGNTTHEIELRPLTLLAQDGSMKIGMPRRVILDPEVTVYHADRVVEVHARCSELMELVFQGTKMDETTLAYRHVKGLIDLTLKFLEMGVPLAWRYPESYLHPKFQCQLGDLVIAFAKGGEGRWTVNS